MYESASFCRQIETGSMVSTPTLVDYAGPGNVVSGASAWWGLRAYTLASIGSNAVRLRENGGNTEQNFTTIAGGGLDLAAISSFKGANSLFVVKLYDQTGNGFDLTQITAANQPGFTLSGLGSNPVMEFSSASQTIVTVGPGPTTPQPFTLNGVARYDGTGQGELIAGSGSFAQIGFNLSGANPNTAFLYDTAVGGPVTCTDGVWHAVQGVFNSTSSIISINGSNTTVNPGPNDFSTVGGTTGIGGDTLATFLDGKITEAGIWYSGFSTANIASMNSNQRNYWGV